MANISKPMNDSYTGMLAISLLALIGGCVLLWLDYDQYKGVEPPPIKREPTALAPRKPSPPEDNPAAKDGKQNEDKKGEMPADKDKDKGKDKKGDDGN